MDNSNKTPTPNPDGTEFRDLLRGRIDIIQYLTAQGGNGGDRSGAASVENGFAGIPDQLLEDKATLHAALMLPTAFGNNNNNISISHSQASGVPPNQSLSVQAGPSSSSGQRSQMFRMDGGHPVRLPDSPPETDSGAGSAGSPSSGSENSPYSPPFQNYGHGLQGTVIHPPVGHHQTTGAGGVILGVHSMDLSFGPGNQGPPSTRPMTLTHHHPQMTPGGAVEYPYAPSHTPGPTHGALAPPQVSPPSIGGNTCPPSPFLNGQAVASLDSSMYSGEAPGSCLSRKRMRADNGQYVKKTEPSSPRTSVSVDESVYDLDGYHQQCIRFQEFQKDTFHSLCDQSGRELRPLGFHVVADKGFNFSAFDATFVNQKKNHFQISVHIEAPDPMPPKFIKLETGLKPIKEFKLDFFGVKMEMNSSVVQIKQSQTDRKPVPYEPVKLDIPAQRVTKVTVARLHFSETTMNNQRKNGRPNPDQKYFLLVVSLNAVTGEGEEHRIVSYASEKVIVRASNPGQFDSGESEVHWQKGPGGNSIFHPGSICVGTDRPLGLPGMQQAALNVGGDIAYTGTIFHPSDQRFKENVSELDASEALSRMSQIRIVHYDIRPEVAEEWGLSEEERKRRTGVLAQELREVLPDAVREDGDYLQVDDTRLFYESAVAVKELCRLTGNMEGKIEEFEKLNQKFMKIAKLKRLDSLRSTSSGASSGISSHCRGSYLSISRSSVGSASPAPPRKDKGLDNVAGPQVKYTPGTRPHHHRHHRHCHHYCRAPDRGLCSNKIIQTTIIVLVIVMAFCLIAMATLYILDWHKRNYPTPYTSPHGGHTKPTDTPQNKSKEPLGNIYEVKGSTPRPPDWPDWLGMNKEPPPPLHPCYLNCQQYCCPNRYTYEVSMKDKKIRHEDTAIVLQVGKDFNRDKTEKKRPKVAFDTGVDDTKDGRRKRESKTKDPEDEEKGERVGPDRIEILGLNVSIGQEYCYGKGCSDPLGGNFTFFIPVSRYMPHIPLEIQFEVRKDRFVEFCETQATEHCEGVEKQFAFVAGEGPQKPKGDIEEKHSNRFELPVGFYQRSAYKFRVGLSTTSCNEPHLVGQNYEEYNLIFYRVCSG